MPRLKSIEVFRGLAILVCVFLLYPSKTSLVYEYLRHSGWYGIYVFDVVMPTFLFLMGFTLFHKVNKDAFNVPWIVPIIFKGILLFIFGYIYNWLHQYNVNPVEFKLFGFIQRMAMAYMLAAFILFRWRHRIKFVIVIAMAFIYQVAMQSVGTDNYHIDTNFHRSVDLFILGNQYLSRDFGSYFDEYGLVGVFPCATVIIWGYAIAEYCHRHNNDFNKLYDLLGICGVMLGLSVFMHFTYEPIIKPIWTVSYILMTCSIITLLTLAMIFTYDIHKRTSAISWFFATLGRNSFLMFVLAAVIERSASHFYIGEVTYWRYFYITYFKDVINPYLGALKMSIAFIVLICILVVFIDVLWRELLNLKNRFTFVDK
jgi:predicted acyltransferase